MLLYRHNKFAGFSLKNTHTKKEKLLLLRQRKCAMAHVVAGVERPCIE
jgi:hypothetical protein